MKIINFTLYGDIENHLVPISSQDNDFLYGTYNENLQENEHDQFILTFSIAEKVAVRHQIVDNPNMRLITMGAKLVLITDNRRIDFIIKDISPNNYRSNHIFNITAQDEVSLKWQKMHIGYSYSNIDTGIENIHSIAEKVLKDNDLLGWKVANTLDKELGNEKISHEVENSNPYNVIIEACNTLNALMRVDYATKTLDFYRRKLIQDSGYRLNPYTTATDNSVSYSSDEMTTVLHVTGGVDENNMSITILPDVPIPIRNFLRTYSRKAGFDSSGQPITQTWWDNGIEGNYDIKTIVSSLIGLTSDQQELCNTFAQLADTPELYCLGQSLINFDALNHLMTQKEKEWWAQQQLKLRKKNLKLKLLSNAYYNTLNNIYTALITIDSYARNGYNGEWAEGVENSINQALLKLQYALSTYTIYTSSKLTLDKVFEECAGDGFETYNWYKLSEDYEKMYDQYIIQANNIILGSEPAESDSLENRINYDTQKAEKDLLQEKAAAAQVLVNAFKGIIFLAQKYTLQSASIDVKKQFLSLSQDSDKLWAQIYREIPQVIYEGTYENADEVDAIGLFNQAIAYFEDLQHIQASHNITTLDMTMLIPITTPRLTVGSKIKAYNETPVEYDADGNPKLYDDLIVTSITTPLRAPLQLTISVEEFSRYQSILGKLIKSI